MTRVPGELRPHPQVVATAVDDDEMALLHLETKAYFSLNATGAAVWNGLKDGLTIEQIADRLQAVFDVDASTATQSVEELLEQLLEQKLLERHD